MPENIETTNGTFVQDMTKRNPQIEVEVSNASIIYNTTVLTEKNSVFIINN